MFRKNEQGGLEIISDDKNNKRKVTHFGQKGANDFTITGDKERAALSNGDHQDNQTTGFAEKG